MSELTAGRAVIAEKALAAGRPAVIEVPIDPEEFPVPATPARRAATAARAS